MSKLENLRRMAGSNAAESMGTVPAPPMPGESALAAPSVPPRLQGVIRSKNVADIPVAKIIPDRDQPRESFDEESLGRLAESMRTRGQLQPIRVRWDEEEGLYVMICGERRWRAARLAGLKTLSCVIADEPADASELLALQLIENALREDLQPIEQARAFRSLMDQRHWSTRDLARELALTQSSVVKALALLEAPAQVQEKVEQGALSPATAYEVSKLEDPFEQAMLAVEIMAESLTRDQASERVRQRSGRTTQGRGEKSAGRNKGRGARPSSARPSA